MKYLPVVFFFFNFLLFGLQLDAQANPDPGVGFREVNRILHDNRAFNFKGPAVSLISEERSVKGNEGLFYFIIAILLYIAMVRVFFYKYVSTLFTLFFRATLRQQQLREQLLQAPLPALLLNIFFVFSLATYLTFLGVYYEMPVAQHFWSMLFYTIGIVALIYTGKFIILKMAGWVFGISSVADTYIFVVFLINKMIGIFLIPVLVLMAFPEPVLLPVVVIFSYVLLTCMLIYRFIISYRPVRAEIKLNRLHFFLYLCAFELAPLLLIYKVLLAYMDSRY